MAMLRISASELDAYTRKVTAQQDAAYRFVQGALPVGYHTGVEVDPVCLFPGQGGVGGQLHGGGGSAEGGAPAGGEENQVGARGGEGGGGYQVVARAVEHV